MVAKVRLGLSEKANEMIDAGVKIFVDRRADNHHNDIAPADHLDIVGHLQARRGEHLSQQLVGMLLDERHRAAHNRFINLAIDVEAINKMAAVGQNKR